MDNKREQQDYRVKELELFPIEKRRWQNSGTFTDQRKKR